MLEIQIKEEPLVGYDKPVYIFECPMCNKSPVRDFDRVYVRTETWRHVVAMHRVVQSKLNVVVVASETLEGMEKA